MGGLGFLSAEVVLTLAVLFLTRIMLQPVCIKAVEMIPRFEKYSWEYKCARIKRQLKIKGGSILQDDEHVVRRNNG